jgi:DNA-binding ferritin-like protein
MTKTKKSSSLLTGRKPTRKTKSIKSATSVKSAKNINNSVAKTIVPTFLHMLNTVKLYHWKTTSFSTHKATDELYGSLGDKIDEFVEVMLGKNELGGRAKLLNVHIIKLDMFSNNEAFKKQIEIYKAFLLNLSNDASFSLLMNADLLAIRDEILADLNKFLYLLTLK